MNFEIGNDSAAGILGRHGVILFWMSVIVSIFESSNSSD